MNKLPKHGTDTFPADLLMYKRHVNCEWTSPTETHSTLSQHGKLM